MNKAGKILKPLKGRGGKLTWTGVDQAQRAQATAIGVKNRKPGIEADSRFAGDQRVVGKPVVQKRVRHDHGRTIQDDVAAGVWEFSRERRRPGGPRPRPSPPDSQTASPDP